MCCETLLPHPLLVVFENVEPKTQPWSVHSKRNFEKTSVYRFVIKNFEIKLICFVYFICVKFNLNTPAALDFYWSMRHVVRGSGDQAALVVSVAHLLSLGSINGGGWAKSNSACQQGDKCLLFWQKRRLLAWTLSVVCILWRSFIFHAAYNSILGRSVTVQELYRGFVSISTNFSSQNSAPMTSTDTSV